MVKNLIGGCKSKKIARKFAGGEPVSSTRMASNPYEIYAVVMKMYGNGRCLVKTERNQELQCVIRNKFKGRFKRNNVVAVGTYLLVGLREWEENTGFKTCDLLEVYSPQDQTMLYGDMGFKALMALGVVEKEDDIFGSGGGEEPPPPEMAEEEGGVASSGALVSSTGEVIDIDDI